jgi:hypothetical protein
VAGCFALNLPACPNCFGEICPLPPDFRLQSGVDNKLFSFLDWKTDLNNNNIMQYLTIQAFSLALILVTGLFFLFDTENEMIYFIPK